MFLLRVLFVALFYCLSVHADQIAITDLPLYSEATLDVRLCVSTQHSDYISSYGCTVTNPAGCLCSDASSSYRVASAISDCIGGVVDWSSGRSEFITATQIFASYCLTNAGISARDQTLLQDFPLYSRAQWELAFCATSLSSSFSTAFGCDFYTPAACLCGTSQSSIMIQSAMFSCASEAVISSQFSASTITELWSSYCAANLATSATRSIDAAVTESGSAPTGAAASSAAPSATATTPMNTATGAQSGSSTSPTANPPTSGSGSSSSSSSGSGSGSGSGLSVGAEIGLAIGCAFGAALLTMMATWWKPAQVGRFVTCGTWPRKTVDTHTARAQMTQIFTGHLRPGPSSHVQYA